jgi:hypothetical protein
MRRYFHQQSAHMPTIRRTFQDELEQSMCVPSDEPLSFATRATSEKGALRDLLKLVDINTSDISDVNYSDGGYPLVKPFRECAANDSAIDNMTIVQVEEASHFEGTKFDKVGTCNLLIRACATESFVNPTGFGIKGIRVISVVPAAFVAKTLQRRGRLALDDCKRISPIGAEKSRFKGQVYKLSCADWKLTDKVLGTEMAQFQIELEKHDLFLFDIDFKIDMAATAQPRNLVEEHLRTVEWV